jgi:hypothetical protein
MERLVSASSEVALRIDAVRDEVSKIAKEVGRRCNVVYTGHMLIGIRCSAWAERGTGKRLGLRRSGRGGNKAIRKWMRLADGASHCLTPGLPQYLIHMIASNIGPPRTPLQVGTDPAGTLPRSNSTALS